MTVPEKVAVDPSTYQMSPGPSIFGEPSEPSSSTVHFASVSPTEAGLRLRRGARRAAGAAGEGRDARRADVESRCVV